MQKKKKYKKKTFFLNMMFWDGTFGPLWFLILLLAKERTWNKNYLEAGKNNKLPGSNMYEIFTAAL